jgi:hypothetical protein
MGVAIVIKIFTNTPGGPFESRGLIWRKRIMLQSGLL